MIKYPDYENSILSVTSSILKHYGAEPKHSTLPLLDELLKTEPRNVILMLFDGMGTASIEEILPEDSFIRTHLVSSVSSVFPPTTVAATTSVQSGLAPIEHGWLGWYLYFKEAGDNVTVFRNTRQSDGKPASEKRLADMYMPYTHICDIISQAAPDVNAGIISPHAGKHCYSAGSTCRFALNEADKPGRHFMYCYWLNPDTDMHICGTASRKVRQDIKGINRNLEKLSRRLDSDSLVIVIADHGLINTEWFCFEDYPRLQAMMRKPPSIERRASSLFIRDGMQDEFRKEFESTFGDKFLLLSHEEVIEKKLFGEGTEHSRVEEFLGDFLAISTGKWSLNGQRGDMDMKASHAGLTEEEMMVPLIVFRGAE